MIAVIQRAASASVVADGVPAGKCGKGLFVLCGVVDGDSEKDADTQTALEHKEKCFFRPVITLRSVVESQNRLISLTKSNHDGENHHENFCYNCHSSYGCVSIKHCLLIQ